MKAAFISLATLALTAFAAPTILNDNDVVASAVVPVTAATNEKRGAENAGDIIKSLTQGNDKIKEITGSLSMLPFWL